MTQLISEEDILGKEKKVIYKYVAVDCEDETQKFAITITVCGRSAFVEINDDSHRWNYLQYLDYGRYDNIDELIEDKVRKIFRNPVLIVKQKEKEMKTTEYIVAISDALDQKEQVILGELIRCKVCLKKRLCSLYREAHDENGFCAWGVKEEE